MNDEKRPKLPMLPIAAVRGAIHEAAATEAQMARARAVIKAGGFTVSDVEAGLRALRDAGVRLEDVRAPNLSRFAVNARAGAHPTGNPPPAEGPSNPDLTHSAEQEPSVTELTPNREPTPEERRDAWHSLMTSLEGWLLGTEQRAEQAALLLDVLERSLAYTGREGPRGVEAEKARRWAARRLLEQVRDLQAPRIPLDDAKGQGSILELFPGAREAVERPLDVAVLMGESTAVENPGEDDGRPCRGECGIDHGPDGGCL